MVGSIHRGAQSHSEMLSPVARLSTLSIMDLSADLCCHPVNKGVMRRQDFCNLPSVDWNPMFGGAAGWTPEKRKVNVSCEESRRM